VEGNGATKVRGRPALERRDPTMRYIAKKRLWDAVALQCGITPAAVRYWQRVPAARVRDVEAAIGRRRSLIRPDIYGRKSKHTNNPTP
jgi:hypothetical protein